VSPADVTRTRCDVLVPCATGGLIDARVARTLPCAVVAGAANNQLSDRSGHDASAPHSVHGGRPAPDQGNRSGHDASAPHSVRGSRPAPDQANRSEAALVLARRGIVYAPDFVANSGGAIHLVGREVLGWTDEQVRRRTLQIGRTLRRVFADARTYGITTEQAAQNLAARRLADAA
jgi:leucine dehydrogenase